MARHTEEENRRRSSGKYVVQPVIPALPLCPVKEKTSLDDKAEEISHTKAATSDNKAQEALQTEQAEQSNGSGPFETGGWSTPNDGFNLQFGDLEGDHEMVIDSPLTQPDSLSDVTAFNSLCGVLAPKQVWRSDSQIHLPDASINKISTQEVSSQPSSASATPKIITINSSQTPQRTQQTSVVQLPADASISSLSCLNISFLYQEDLDSTSPTSTIRSGSPAVFTPPSTASEQRTPAGTLGQALVGGDTPAIQPENRELELITYRPTNISVHQLDPAGSTMMQPLLAHLARLFDERIGCDQQIVIDVPSNPPNSYPIQAHKAIISRNDVLTTLMQGKEPRPNEDENIRIAWPARRNYDPRAFSAAVRYLYNDEVFGIEKIEQITWLGEHQHIHHWRMSQLCYTITYWLFGLILRAVDIQHQAQQMVVGLINWDTISFALSVAADLCDQPDLIDDLPNDDLRPIPSQEPDSAAINPPSHRQTVLTSAVTVGNTLKTITYHFWTSQINLQTFRLDSVPEQHVLKPLLPLTRELLAFSRPRLPIHAIQFGQLPPTYASEPAPPPPAPASSLHDRIISAMVLNLPLADLNAALSVLGAEATRRGLDNSVTMRQFVEAAVAEREVRRRIVLNSRSVKVEARMGDRGAWGVVGWRESVVEGEERGRWQVGREWEGFV